MTHFWRVISCAEIVNDLVKLASFGVDLLLRHTSRRRRLMVFHGVVVTFQCLLVMNFTQALDRWLVYLSCGSKTGLRLSQLKLPDGAGGLGTKNSINGSWIYPEIPEALLHPAYRAGGIQIPQAHRNRAPRQVQHDFGVGYGDLCFGHSLVVSDSRFLLHTIHDEVVLNVRERLVVNIQNRDAYLE